MPEAVQAVPQAVQAVPQEVQAVPQAVHKGGSARKHLTQVLSALVLQALLPRQPVEALIAQRTMHNQL